VRDLGWINSHQVMPIATAWRSQRKQSWRTPPDPIARVLEALAEHNNSFFVFCAGANQSAWPAEFMRGPLMPRRCRACKARPDFHWRAGG